MKNKSKALLRKGITVPSSSTIDIRQWIKDIMENMEAYEDREIVIWKIPKREAVASWVIKSLANPECKGSAEVFKAIAQRRNFLIHRKKRKAIEIRKKRNT